MPKKRKIFGQIGSFIDPVFRYLVEMKLVANPIDEHGHKIIQHMYRMCNHQRVIFMQPNFKYSYIQNNDCRSSYIEVKYVNGWQNTFYLENSTFKNVMMSMKIHNDEIFKIRTMQGQQDVFNDELKIV